MLENKQKTKIASLVNLAIKSLLSNNSPLSIEWREFLDETSFLIKYIVPERAASYIYHAINDDRSSDSDKPYFTIEREAYFNYVITKYLLLRDHLKNLPEDILELIVKAAVQRDEDSEDDDSILILLKNGCYDSTNYSDMCSNAINDAFIAYITEDLHNLVKDDFIILAHALKLAPMKTLEYLSVRFSSVWQYILEQSAHFLSVIESNDQQKITFYFQKIKLHGSLKSKLCDEKNLAVIKEFIRTNVSNDWLETLAILFEYAKKHNFIDELLELNGFCVFYYFSASRLTSLIYETYRDANLDKQLVAHNNYSIFHKAFEDENQDLISYIWQSILEKGNLQQIELLLVSAFIECLKKDTGVTFKIVYSLLKMTMTYPELFNALISNNPKFMADEKKVSDWKRRFVEVEREDSFYHLLFIKVVWELFDKHHFTILDRARIAHISNKIVQTITSNSSIVGLSRIRSQRDSKIKPRLLQLVEYYINELLTTHQKIIITNTNVDLLFYLLDESKKLYLKPFAILSSRFFIFKPLTIDLVKLRGAAYQAFLTDLSLVYDDFLSLYKLLQELKQATQGLLRYNRRYGFDSYEDTNEYKSAIYQTARNALNIVCSSQVDQYQANYQLLQVLQEIYDEVIRARPDNLANAWRELVKDFEAIFPRFLDYNQGLALP